MLDLIHPDLRSLALPIDSLNEDPKNANAHNDRSHAAIAESFKRFGQRKPIVVRREGMIVEAGNGTLASLRAAGWTHLACIVCDDDEQTATAYALADNQAARLSHWNPNALRDRLDELTQTGYDVQGLGWTADELVDALAGRASELTGQLDGGASESESDGTEGANAASAEHNEDDDKVPETPPEPITQRGEVIQLGNHVLHCADCMDVLRSLPDNSVDAIVTDSPYGLSPDGRARTWDDIEALRREGKGPKVGFLGNAWDAGVPGVTWARECLRVLKPGGHLIAHSATRTVHRLACAIEDAGFEIRDTVSWLHWQGFPKSHDVSKAIDEHLNATREVIGVRTDGVGNTDRSMHKHEGFAASRSTVFEVTAPATDDAKRWDGWGTALKPACEPAVLARKPLSEPTVAANVLRWGTGALNIDACRYQEGDSAWPGPQPTREEMIKNIGPKRMQEGWSLTGNEAVGYGPRHRPQALAGIDGRWPANIYACPKPATSEREAGCEEVDAKHCTVKPIKFYRWALRLVTPPGGTVLEPFGGSGTTVVAGEREGFKVIAVEREPKYCDIIRARVTHALENK